MFKLKHYNLFINNFNIIYVYYLFKINNYIIFFNLNNKSNTFLLKLKNEITKVHCFSLSLNSNIIANLFSKNFKFLGASTFSIYILKYAQFNNILKLLNNLYIIFSFKKYFSNVMVNTDLINMLNNNITVIYLHYYLYLIISYIILLILYCLNIILINIDL